MGRVVRLHSPPTIISSDTFRATDQISASEFLERVRPQCAEVDKRPPPGRTDDFDQRLTAAVKRITAQRSRSSRHKTEVSNGHLGVSLMSAEGDNSFGQRLTETVKAKIATRRNQLPPKPISDEQRRRALAMAACL